MQNHTLCVSTTQIMQEIALFSGKIYTAGTNFTRPPVVTNLNSEMTIEKEINLKTMSSFSFSGPSVIVNRRNEVWLELDADIWVGQRRWSESFVRKVFLFDSWFRVHIVTWRVVVININLNCHLFISWFFYRQWHGIMITPARVSPPIVFFSLEPHSHQNSVSRFSWRDFCALNLALHPQ